MLQIERIPGITPEARQVLKVPDVLTANPTTMQVVDFVKVSQPLSIASPVPEASMKPENQLNFQSVSEKVRLIGFRPRGRCWTTLSNCKASSTSRFRTT